MAEPQPAGIREGDQAPSAIPGSAVDRMAAASLSNLDAAADSDTVLKQTDTEALGKAMKDLNVREEGTKGARSNDASRESPKTVVKVDATDVTLLAQHLDVSKSRATELLKTHDADVVKAIAAWFAMA